MGKGSGVSSHDTFRPRSPIELGERYMLHTGCFTTIDLVDIGRREIEIVIYNVDKNGKYLPIPEDWRHRRSTIETARVSKEIFEGREVCHVGDMISADGYWDTEKFVETFHPTRSLAWEAFDRESDIIGLEKDRPREISFTDFRFSTLEKWKNAIPTAQKCYTQGFKLVTRDGQDYIRKGNCLVRILRMIGRCLYLLLFSLSQKDESRWSHAQQRTFDFKRLVTDTDEQLSELEDLWEDIEKDTNWRKVVAKRQNYLTGYTNNATNNHYLNHALSLYLFYYHQLRERLDFSTEPGVLWDNMLLLIINGYAKGDLNYGQLQRILDKTIAVYKISKEKVGNGGFDRWAKRIEGTRNYYYEQLRGREQDSKALYDELEDHLDREIAFNERYQRLLEKFSGEIPLFKAAEFSPKTIELASYLLYEYLSVGFDNQELHPYTDEEIEAYLTNIWLPLFTQHRDLITENVESLLSQKSSAWLSGITNTFRALINANATLPVEDGAFLRECKREFTRWMGLCNRFYELQHTPYDQLEALLEQALHPEMEDTTFTLRNYAVGESPYEIMELYPLVASKAQFSRDYKRDGNWLDINITMGDGQTIRWIFHPPKKNPERGEDPRSYFTRDCIGAEEQRFYPDNPEKSREDTINEMLDTYLIPDLKRYYFNYHPEATPEETEQFASNILMSLTQTAMQAGDVLLKSAHSRFCDPSHTIRDLERAESCPDYTDLQLIPVIMGLFYGARKLKPDLDRRTHPLLVTLNADESSVFWQGQDPASTYYLVGEAGRRTFTNERVVRVPIFDIRYDWKDKAPVTVKRHVEIVQAPPPPTVKLHIQLLNFFRNLLRKIL